MFNSNLKRLMDAHKITPEALAVKMHTEAHVSVTAGTIGAWARGTRTPGTANLMGLAKAFGCTLDDLMVGEEKAAV